MTTPPALAELLNDPTRAADVPTDQVPGFLVRLAAVQAALAARLTVQPAVAAPSDTDVLLDVDQAAALVGHSPSWMRKHGHRLPGFHQPGGRGTRARWSHAALIRWAQPDPDLGKA